MDWVTPKGLKGSNPMEVAEFAVANHLTEGAAVMEQDHFKGKVKVLEDNLQA
jgi:hypothetical protein